MAASATLSALQLAVVGPIVTTVSMVSQNAPHSRLKGSSIMSESADAPLRICGTRHFGRLVSDNVVYDLLCVCQAMRARHRAEKEAEQTKSPEAQATFSKAKKRFGALHGISSLANLLVVIAALFQAWTLSSYLDLSALKV
jgi:hypothetical protein